MSFSLIVRLGLWKQFGGFVVNSKKEITIGSFYRLSIPSMWRYFKSETLAFWMICFYFFLEYVRPQSIYPVVDFLPWAQIALLGALIGSLVDQSVRWVSTQFNLWLIVFFVLILFSSFFAYDSSVSYANLESFYSWLIIYFLIINIVNTEKRLFIFLCIFFLASFKLSLSLSITWAQRGFSFTGWGLMGPPGFFQNSGELSIQMLVFWPLAWAFFKALKSDLNHTLYFILLLMPVTAIMVVLGASSRGAQLALLAQLIIMNASSIFRPKVIVSCIVAFAILWTLLPQEQKDRFQIAGDDRSSIQRLLYWENGVEMLNENPGLGVGFFNYIPYYERFYRDDILYEGAELPHNIFIQVGADLGYPALIVYCIIILLSARKAYNIRVKFRKGVGERFAISMVKYLNISLVGFVVAGQFVSVVYYPFLWIHLAILVCCNHVLITSENSNRKPLSRSKRYKAKRINAY